MTVSEMATQLGLPERTVRRWCTTGKIRARKEGKEWIVEGLPVIMAESGDEVAVAELEGTDIVAASSAIMSAGVTEQLRQVESRLAHIEGLMAGQFAATMTERMDTMTAEVSALKDIMAAIPVIMAANLAEGWEAQSQGIRDLTEEVRALRRENEELRKTWWVRCKDWFLPKKLT